MQLANYYIQDQVEVSTTLTAHNYIKSQKARPITSLEGSSKKDNPQSQLHLSQKCKFGKMDTPWS